MDSDSSSWRLHYNYSPFFLLFSSLYCVRFSSVLCLDVRTRDRAYDVEWLVRARIKRTNDEDGRLVLLAKQKYSSEKKKGKKNEKEKYHFFPSHIGPIDEFLLCSRYYLNNMA